MNTKSELMHHVALFFNCDDAMVQMLHLDVNGSMSSKIEDGLDGSIFRFKLLFNGKTIIVKMKNSSFINNVGETMNYYGLDSFRENYKMGFGLFYTRNCHSREKYIYSYLDDSLKKYIPHYYGSIDVSSQECLHIMEDIPIVQSPVRIDYIIDFLSDLHERYYEDEKAVEKMMVNIPTLDDFHFGKHLSDVLFSNIQKLYPNFPSEIINDLKDFSNNPQYIFEQLHSFPLTICHGDFAIKNLSFIEKRVVVYDWELSTFNNPEFDLVSFMVFYPTELTSNLISNIINRYYGKIKKRICYDVQSALYFNTKLLMASRFHAMMNIALRVEMPYMDSAINNWIYLYNFLKNNFNEHIYE